MSTLRVDTILGESGAERRGLMSYAIICDQKSHTGDGGSFTSGAWRTRDLNTEIADPDGIVSIANNQFTLGAGDYLIEASAPAYSVNQHLIRLQNIKGSTTVQYGEAAYADGTGTDAKFNRPFGVAIDSADNIIVADYFNNRIRKIDSAGNVTTIAGSGSKASADGTSTNASFNRPYDVAIDSAGNIIVTDLFGHLIRKIQ